jgi:hypothetical protein
VVKSMAWQLILIKLTKNQIETCLTKSQWNVENSMFLGTNIPVINFVFSVFTKLGTLSIFGSQVANVDRANRA